MLIVWTLETNTEMCATLLFDVKRHISNIVVLYFVYFFRIFTSLTVNHFPTKTIGPAMLPLIESCYIFYTWNSYAHAKHVSRIKHPNYSSGVYFVLSRPTVAIGLQSSFRRSTPPPRMHTPIYCMLRFKCSILSSMSFEGNLDKELVSFHPGGYGWMIKTSNFCEIPIDTTTLFFNVSPVSFLLTRTNGFK